MKLHNFLSSAAMAATSEAVTFATADCRDLQAMRDIVNVPGGRNTATMDRCPNRIVPGGSDGGFALAIMAKDVRSYLENVRGPGTADRIGAVVSGIHALLDGDAPGSDSTRICACTRDDGQTGTAFVETCTTGVERNAGVALLPLYLPGFPDP